MENVNTHKEDFINDLEGFNIFDEPGYISDQDYTDAMNSFYKACKEEDEKLSTNIDIVKTKINYPFERIQEYLEDGYHWHLGYVRVYEEKNYKSYSYPNHKHYSVVDDDNVFNIPSYLMRQDDNDEDAFHSLVWQTVGMMGDDYSGFILFPLTDGTYWVLNYEC